MGEEGRKLLEAVPEGQRPGQPGNRGPEVPQLPSGRAGKHPLPDGWTGRGGKPLRLRCLWEPAWAGGGFSHNRILYAGQLYDQETGQYYLRARYYNPTIGRFSQEGYLLGETGLTCMRIVPTIR